MCILSIAAEVLVWTDKIQIHQPAWLFITLFILLGVIAGVRFYYGSSLKQTLESAISFQVGTRIFEDNSALQKQLDIILYVLYIFSAGLILYVVEIRFELEPYGLSGGRLYLLNLAFIGLVFLARVILINAVGFFFNTRVIFREYLYNLFIFNKLIGVILLPLLLFVVYTEGILMEVFQWIALVCLILVLSMRMIRAGIFSFRKGVSIFYMFLYLCALEIAPLVLLYRWLEGIL